MPLRTYTLLALTTVATMGFSNASLGYLNYPTQVLTHTTKEQTILCIYSIQVIFKCCKLIPVLIGGILIQGKRHGALDFVASGVMCLGLILFTLADSKVDISIKSVLLR